MGFSTVGGVSPAEIWGFSVRTLTQAKFPFWSATILHSPGSVPVPAMSTGSLTIQPPSGETWLISVQSHLPVSTSGSYLAIFGCVGTSCTNIDTFRTGGTYGDIFPHLEFMILITNSNYLQLYAYNASAQSISLFYMYSGFKLSQPQWIPERQPTMRPPKLPTDLPLPDPIKPLSKYKALVLGVNPAKPYDYDLAIVLEEDTPVAVDTKTGFPVERYSAYVSASALADLILKFRRKELDPVTTGYRKYLEKWFKEGINLGVSF